LQLMVVASVESAKKTLNFPVEGSNF